MEGKNPVSEATWKVERIPMGVSMARSLDGVPNSTIARAVVMQIAMDQPVVLSVRGGLDKELEDLYSLVEYRSRGDNPEAIYNALFRAAAWCDKVLRDDHEIEPAIFDFLSGIRGMIAEAIDEEELKNGYPVVKEGLTLDQMINCQY